MRLEQLEYLIEIARQNSMSIASEHLHLAPQTLSISMKNLEKEMGFTIFDHTSKGTTLTKNGERVLKFALKTLSEYETIISECSEIPVNRTPKISFNSHLQGKLTIYCNPIYTTTILPYYTRIFLNLYSNVKLTVLPGTSQQVCDHIKNAAPSDESHSTLGLVILPFVDYTCLTDLIPPNTNLQLKVFGCSQYYCCVSKSSPLAKFQSMSLKKLLTHPVILYTASENPLTPLIYLLKQVQEPNIVLSVSAIPFWVQSIQDDLGIGFINSLMLSENSYLKEHMNQLHIIKVREPLFSVNGFLYSSTPSPLMKAFMNLWPDYIPSKTEPMIDINPLTLYK